ncbi:mucin-7-like isoform X4 [Acanthochromis polyacanthus]|uniref:mucin-7-like isoform X4 n=1 Tax=Acanthochromis polyacanthus TaxID=80966 RepID=UPI00223401CA|nr:mucin-7-like isoform X4 [Acanthochromis polyacanthus]
MSNNGEKEERRKGRSWSWILTLIQINKTCLFHCHCFLKNSVQLSLLGELIGIDYLFRQTGRAMQNMEPDTEETDHMLEDLGTEEDLEDEGFEDANVDPTVGLLDITDPSSQPSTAIATSACSAGTPTSVQPPTSEATSSAPYLPAPTDLPAAVPTTVPTPAQPLQQLAKDLSSVTSFGTSAATTSSASAPPLPTTVSAAISTATDAPAGPSRPPAMSPAQYHQQFPPPALPLLLLSPPQSRPLSPLLQLMLLVGHQLCAQQHPSERLWMNVVFLGWTEWTAWQSAWWGHGLKMAKL